MVRTNARILVLPYSIAVCLLSLIGMVHFLSSIEENKCDMTFMYEFPQYTEIPLPLDVALKYKQYSLVAYSEGFLTEKVRKMKFTGIPVLFIPGHSGSGKQVRSIASISLRKSINLKYNFYFDFFAVDFNGEYSALFGGVLEAQTEFVHHSLKKIMSLYHKRKPKSVVLIGHSMGGMIAKGLYLHDDFDPTIINTIITLATPHDPVVLLDKHIESYYNNVNSYWSKFSHENTTIVSIGGGQKDIHVKSSLTKSNHVDYCTSSGMIPAVWTPTDHKSIVWCKRLVKVLCRVLFDSADRETRQISTDIQLRRNILRYHLLDRYAGKSYLSSMNLGSQVFTPTGEWIEQFALQDTTVYESGVAVPTYILIKILPLQSNPQHEMLVVESVNMDTDHWIFGCNANEFDGHKKYCSVGENLSGYGRYVPSIKGKRLRVYLNISDLRDSKHTHVLVKITPTYSYTRVSYDIFRRSDRNIILPFTKAILPNQVIKTVEKKHLYYNLIFKDMSYVWLANRFQVKPTKCINTRYFQSVATIKVPWSNQNTRHVTHANSSSHYFGLSLFKPRPVQKEYSPNDYIHINFEFDPLCEYTVVMQLSVLDSLGAVLFTYSPILPSYIVAILLFILAYQLIEMETKQSCSMLHLALINSCSNPLSFFIGVKMISSMVWVYEYVVKWLAPGVNWIIPPTPDTAELFAQDLDGLILPPLLYSLALACVVILGLVGYVSIVFWGKTANSYVISFLTKTFSGSVFYSEWMMKVFEMVPGIVALFMVSVGYNTCGGLAFSIGFALYFLKLIALYEDYFEKLLLLPINILKIYLINRLRRYRRRGTPDQTQPGGSLQEANRSSITNTALLNGGTATNTVNTANVNGRPTTSTASQEIDNKSSPSTSQIVSDVIADGGIAIAAEVLDVDEDDDDRLELTGLNFHFTLFLLWAMCTLLSFPSSLVWAKNFPETSSLSRDPHSIFSMIMSGCAVILWTTGPSRYAYYYTEVSNLIYMIGCFVLLYAQSSLYRIIPAITLVFLIMSLQQFICSIFHLYKSPPSSNTKQNGGFTTSAKKNEEIIRDSLDIHVNVIYKTFIEPFRNIFGSRTSSSRIADTNNETLNMIDNTRESGVNEAQSSKNNEDQLSGEDDELVKHNKPKSFTSKSNRTANENKTKSSNIKHKKQKNKVSKLAIEMGDDEEDIVDEEDGTLSKNISLGELYLKNVHMIKNRSDEFKKTNDKENIDINSEDEYDEDLEEDVEVIEDEDIEDMEDENVEIIEDEDVEDMEDEINAQETNTNDTKQDTCNVINSEVKYIIKDDKNKGDKKSLNDKNIVESDIKKEFKNIKNVVNKTESVDDNDCDETAHGTEEATTVEGFELPKVELNREISQEDEEGEDCDNVDTKNENKEVEEKSNNKNKRKRNRKKKNNNETNERR